MRKPLSSVRKNSLPGTGWRAVYKVRGDLTMRVPEGSLLRQVAVLDTGIPAPIYPEPAVRKIALDLPSPTLATPFSLVEALEKRLAKRLRVSISCGPPAFRNLETRRWPGLGRHPR